MALSLPFSDIARCSDCTKHAQGPDGHDGWRAIDADDRARIYFCPDCRPADHASIPEWADFYCTAVQTLFQLGGYRKIRSLVIWRMRDGQAEKTSMPG